MVIRVPEMTIDMTRLGCDAMRMEIQGFFFLASTSEERQREPIARFWTMAAFWISKEPWSSTMAQSWHSPQLHFTGMCISGMWMLMLRRCPYKSSNWIMLGVYCPSKLQEHTRTHRQAGKRKMEESGKGKLFIRAMAGSGGWEDRGRPMCQRLDGDLAGMTWRMVGPFADWTCYSWGRAGALRVCFRVGRMSTKF